MTGSITDVEVDFDFQNLRCIARRVRQKKKVVQIGEIGMRYRSGEGGLTTDRRRGDGEERGGEREETGHNNVRRYGDMRFINAPRRGRLE